MDSNNKETSRDDLLSNEKQNSNTQENEKDVHSELIQNDNINGKINKEMKEKTKLKRKRKDYEEDGDDGDDDDDDDDNDSETDNDDNVDDNNILIVGEEQNKPNNSVIVNQNGGINEDNESKKVKHARSRKFALIISYCGSKYVGLQVNPEVETIEGHIIEALKKHGGVEEKAEKPNVLKGWMRAARTDKGVHAARNVVTVKILDKIANDPNFLQCINAMLPDDIRIMAIKQVKHYFRVREHCGKRVYKYLLPLSLITVNQNNILFASAVKNKTDYAQDPESLVERLNSLLHKYVGTHHFHNFTERIIPDDPSSQRYMINVEASPNIIELDEENKTEVPTMNQKFPHVMITIHGNSFMLHQIRRMIGAVIAVMRGLFHEDVIEKALSPEYMMNVPEAPGLGLFLEEPQFTMYDQHHCGDLGPIICDDETNQKIEIFKKKYIIDHIMKYDQEHLITANWIFHLFNTSKTYFNPRKFIPGYTPKKKNDRKRNKMWKKQKTNVT